MTKRWFVTFQEMLIVNIKGQWLLYKVQVVIRHDLHKQT
jgi:hypothetical protein